mmetsp:Transcript_23693/g.49021  ORF Transcript_23693/g.49021 Transcript_23693/m.49021 type:complete len:130 (+) Transcript_23693:490-879(+)
MVTANDDVCVANTTSSLSEDAIGWMRFRDWMERAKSEAKRWESGNTYIHIRMSGLFFMRPRYLTLWSRFIDEDRTGGSKLKTPNNFQQTPDLKDLQKLHSFDVLGRIPANSFLLPETAIKVWCLFMFAT